MASSTLGVYLHIPFCERVCPYCDFAVVAAKPLDEELERRYVTALLRELELRADELGGRRLETIYFGGGTPFLLRASSVQELIEAVAARAAPPPPRAQTLEITLELNPGIAQRTSLAQFRAAGVNRLSIGVQSFSDRLLKRLGRAHRATEIRPTLDEAHSAGFENLSLDLIFGIPDETLEAWEEDLDAALAVDPQHLSVYGLTIESGTPYARGVQRGVLRLPAEEATAKMYSFAQERLVAAGFVGYEISNFARPGFESRHNRRYWLRQPVLGLGLSAVSNDDGKDGFRCGVRRTNPRRLGEYLEKVENARLPIAEVVEKLTPAQVRCEAIFLSLRRREGLSAADFQAEFGASARHFFEPEIEKLVGAGLLEELPDGDLRLSSRGRLFSDTVFEAFA